MDNATKGPDIELEQAALTVLAAIKDGELTPSPKDVELVNEIIALPRGVLGTVDVRNLSMKAESFIRVNGHNLLQAKLAESRINQETWSSINQTELQVELFDQFANLFLALTGTGWETVVSPSEVQERMINRVSHASNAMAVEVGDAIGELEAFYKKYRNILFNHAKKLGGLKLVSGGQRAFSKSALESIRISGLYADTQLIPDPIYPYLVTELYQNAKQLQMAICLFHLLQLQPLVEAHLAIPPIFVFPTFEDEMEDGDIVTKRGIENLMLRLLAPVCDGTILSIAELGQYAMKHEDKFIAGVMAAKLFVPPGASSNHMLSGDDALKMYLKGLEGSRDNKQLSEMKKAKNGLLLLHGITERIRPLYHLYENGSEFDAQPLLHQEVHWYYFEKCAQASARSLVREKVLSEGSFQTLRALQDESVSWLASIPVTALAELRKNQEHETFRKELQACTSQLTSAGSAELDEVVREVNHRLIVLIERHKKDIREIQTRYEAKALRMGVGAIASVVAGASALLLPSLAPFLGVTAPTIAIGAGVVGSLGLTAMEKASETSEKNSAKRSMLGILATAHRK